VKPFSEACERNSEPILGVLREHFAAVADVLEIGSGTGQHAVYLAARLPHLVWQPSDLPAALAGIRAWVEEAGLANVRAPLALDVSAQPWPVTRAGAVFSANTAHIMAWTDVARMFEGVGEVLESGGPFALYGPFRFEGGYTSPSNARFDACLRARDAAGGLRDFEALDALAQAAGMHLERAVAMPANNHMLVWRRA